MGKFDDPPDHTPGNSREIRTLDEAIKLIDEWEAAYQALKADHAKLHRDLTYANARLEAMQTLADNFEVLYKAAIEG